MVRGIAVLEDPEELKKMTSSSSGTKVQSKEELMRTINSLGIQRSTTKL